MEYILIAYMSFIHHKGRNTICVCPWNINLCKIISSYEWHGVTDYAVHARKWCVSQVDLFRFLRFNFSSLGSSIVVAYTVTIDSENNNLHPLNNESKSDRASGIETDAERLTLRREQVQCIAVLLANYDALAKTSNFRHLN